MLHKWREALRRLLVRLGLIRPGKIMYIGGSDTLPPPLNREEEAALLARLDAGEEAVRQTLIERNLRLVVYIARRFENTGINIEDLISIGAIGLIKAINTYRTDKNIKLATYASRCIENEILMYLRKNSSQRNEVSLDEPLNTDWDGNELLLRRTRSCGPLRTMWTGSSWPLPLTSCRSGSVRSLSCASACVATKSRPRRRWPTGLGSPSPISPGWRSGSLTG